MKISKKEDTYIRVADYIADVLAGHGIRHIFTVTGGGAMHLNDAFGHHAALSCNIGRASCRERVYHDV